MTEYGAYGKHLATAFRLADAPVIMSRTARDAVVAFTKVSVEADVNFRSTPMASEDAYLICMFMTDHSKLQVWEEGRLVPSGGVNAGQIIIFDLRLRPMIYVDKPLQVLSFYVSRDAMDEIADQSEAPRIGDLRRTPGSAVCDETVVSLLQTVMAGFDRPDAVGKLFIDHVSMALVTHVAQAYGGMRPQTRARRGGLAPWQEKRVKEVIQAKLAGELSVGDLARECNLSHRHFCRAFRHSVGDSPHSYIQTARIDKAKKLLVGTDLKLTDVGSACGFADQAHFTRVFTQFAGMTPGIWRRNTASMIPAE